MPSTRELASPNLTGDADAGSEPASWTGGPREPAMSRWLPWLCVLGGSIGLAAAFTLLVEKIALLKDPSFVQSCCINPSSAAGRS